GAAGGLDVLGGKIQPTGHGLAVERAGPREGEHGAGVDRHALAGGGGIHAEQRGQIGDGRNTARAAPAGGRGGRCAAGRRGGRAAGGGGSRAAAFRGRGGA